MFEHGSGLGFLDRGGPFLTNAAPPMNLPQKRESDFLDRVAGLSDRISSYSSAAFGIAVACLAAGTALRFVIGWSTSDLRLATYLPAVLAAGLLAGVPAAIGVTLASVLIVQWAFMPPYLYLKWGLTDAQQTTLFWYVVSCLFTIYFAHCCRVLLKRLRRRELANQILARELEHRGRNIFTIIEVMLQRSLADDPERAAKISGRLRSISYANELLTSDRPQPTDIKTLLLQEFVPYGEDRLKTQGPQIDIEPETARHLVLVFHELVTNAAKYGSLSTASGQVSVNWKSDGRSLTLTWRESGGPKVEPPSKQGFGSQLIMQCVKSLSGTLQPSYAADGFVCSMTVQLIAHN